MKKFIFLVLLLFLSVNLFAQDSIKVAREDWEFLKHTYTEVDSELSNCEYLNNLYEQRCSLFQSEVYELQRANQLADSIMAKKDIQLEFRKEQLAVVNKQLKDKDIEIWIYRIATSLLIITTVGLTLK